MKNKILPVNNDLASLFSRLTLGIVLFPHGAQKLLGLFNGYGFSGTMNFFTGTMNLPWIIGFFIIVIEFFGPLFLIVGLASRIWAIAIIFLMIGIIVTSHLNNGFFMNWFGNQKGEGYEYHLLVIGLCLALFASGSGKYSLSNIIRVRN